MSLLPRCIIAIVALISQGVAEDEIKIGWIGPLTGGAAAVGVDSAEVARHVFAQASAAGGVAGRPLRFIPEDDQYEAAKTVSAYKRLAQVEGAKVIFVLTYGGMIAIAPLAERDNVVLINPLDCDEELAALPPNSFCVAKRTEDLGIVNAQHALSHGNIPAAIIFLDGDPFMPKVAAATRAYLEKASSATVLFEGTAEKKPDFRSLLVKAKERKARALFLYGDDNFGIAMKQARELGITAPFYSLTIVNSPGFQAGAGDAVHGTFTAGWFAPRTAVFSRFMAAFTARAGRPPLLEVSTVPTQDMAEILVAGLKAILEKGGPLSIEALRNYLYNVRDYQGLSGPITIDKDGAVRTLKVGMYSFSHGEFLAEK